MTEQTARDVTLDETSDKLSVKQLADKFKRFGTDRSGQRAENKKAKRHLKDTPLKAERNITGHGIGSGPNILRTTGTGTRPVSYDKPTENKEQGRLRDYTCLQTKYKVEHGSEVIEECLEKEQGRLMDDTCVLTKYDVEHGSDVTEKNTDIVHPAATLIDRMNYIEIGQLMKDLNMNSTLSPEDDKQKLKQSLFNGRRVDSKSNMMKDVLNKTVQKYKGLKVILLGIYYDVITTVRNESLKENMGEVIEMRFPHYEDELQNMKSVLQNMTEEFEIVVSGETSSGKSTFLNVLLGERILPSHHLHTTASLCRLRNSENRRIECFVEKRIVDKITLNADSDELKGKLDSIMKTLLSQDGGHEPLKAIDIYWPVSSLHESVVLVDTPGIGESDALTTKVIEVVSKSAGYIFIVDSSHAGGVQESGIRKLIEAVAVSPSKEDHIKGLTNMLFVCNKWDMVPVHNRAAVMDDTKRKLRKYCGQLDDWQIITFDGNLELKLLELKANPTDSFKTLLKSLETLMIRTIETRLRDKYRWIRTFVSELLALIKVRMNVAEQSKEDVQLAIKRARNVLDLATKESERCSDIEAVIDKEEKSLLQNLEEYLKSEEVQRQHFDWTDIAPELSKVEEDGPALVITRLKSVIFEWTTSETGPLEEASVRITYICNKMQSDIDSRINNLNHLDLGFILKKGSDHNHTLSTETVTPSKSTAMVVASSPIPRTVGLVILVSGLIPGLVWAINRLASTKKRSVEKMTELTKQIIDKLVSENHLQTCIRNSFTGHYIKWLTKLKSDTQCKITSARTWILGMETELHLNNEQLQMFQSMQTKLNHCSNRLQNIENDI